MDGGGGDDFDDLGGDMGGMDDWGGDDFGDGGGGAQGTDIDELEHQVDELENEVANLSSTVGTVKSENTEISDRIEDVEEDVRNLLDIYEMVTRGINPFVDDNATSDFDLGGGDSLGLFDSDDEAEEEEVDDAVMSADADGFFDDELAEDAEDDEFGEEIEDEEMVNDQDSAGGKTFSELKDEYDSGDAEWAEEGDDEFDDDFDELDDGFEDEDFGGLDDEFDEPDNLDNGAETEIEPVAEPTREPESESLSPIETSDADFEYVQSDQLSAGREKPYLKGLPGDYVGDLVVMEWLEFLVDESTVTDAARAVNYYERIEWIDPAVAEHLRSFLSGFGDIDRNKVDRPGTDHLSRDHHIHSLKYIMQLNGTTATSVILDRWDTFARGGNGF